MSDVVEPRTQNLVPLKTHRVEGLMDIKSIEAESPPINVVEGRESDENNKRSGRSQTSRNTEIVEKVSAVLDKVKRASQVELKDMAKNGSQKSFEDFYKPWQKPTTCPEGEHKNFNHCLCEHREEEQLKHFTPDSYVIIENSKPDVTGEATAKTESVYWKKLPLSASNSENFNNPRLKIKYYSVLPSVLVPEAFDRKKNPLHPRAGYSSSCQKETTPLRIQQKDQSVGKHQKQW
ncbi:uncharacterized protein TNCV_4487351 [Trichonephila clavipes]|nr:uncharacterized protein TNCV_4487351 [Trichonephila clavipes]